MLLPQGNPAPWAASAVRDTVAAIAAQAEYRRSLRDSVMQRLMRWLGDVINELFGYFRDSSAGRIVTTSLVVLLVLLVIARIVVAARAGEDETALAFARRQRVRSYDPWGDAANFARAGRHTEAAHSLFAAVLQLLAARGEVRPHPSKTAGDYARELRLGGSPRARAFHVFRVRYDRIIYGSGVCTPEEYAALLGEAQPFVPLERAA
jgi:hypothetical protein